MRRLGSRGWTCSGAVLTVAVAFALVSAPAGATLQFEERPIPSETTTFRGLVVTDASGVPDVVLVVVGQAIAFPDTEPDRITIVSRTAPGNVPEGCAPFSNEQASGISCPVADYDLLVVDVGAGDDAVISAGGVPALSPAQIDSPNTPVFLNVLLGSGRDKFGSGSGGTEFVSGGPGRDGVKGGESNDLLEGGPGKDTLQGEEGRDLLLGGRGADKLFGGPGVPDLMLGGSGRDLCIGAEPRDRVVKCERVRLQS